MKYRVEVIVRVFPEPDDWMTMREERSSILFDDPPTFNLGRVIGDAARFVGEKAYYGRVLPTPAKEGGRG